MTPTTERGTVAKLLDFLLAESGLKTDAELGRMLNKDSAYMSKLRQEKLALSANMILLIHTIFCVGVKEIIERAGQQARWCK
jgi:hypothetical protein